MSYHYSWISFLELVIITKITIVITSIVNTNKDDSQFIVSAIVIVVESHEVWYVQSILVYRSSSMSLDKLVSWTALTSTSRWNEGVDDFALHDLFCIWSFCSLYDSSDDQHDTNSSDNINDFSKSSHQYVHLPTTNCELSLQILTRSKVLIISKGNLSTVRVILALRVRATRSQPLSLLHRPASLVRSP